MVSAKCLLLCMEANVCQMRTVNHFGTMTLNADPDIAQEDNIVSLPSHARQTKNAIRANNAPSRIKSVHARFLKMHQISSLESIYMSID